MNSVQESKNELEAAIRYAENAISSAKQTIESMEFRQELAKKQYAKQTGREQALEEQNNHLHKEVTRLENENKKLRSEKEASSAPCGCQAYRDLEEARGRAEGEVELLQRTIAELERDVKFYTKKYNGLAAENAELREDKERLTALEIQLRDKIRELKAQVKQ